MSNLIKAYSVSYDEPTKKLDLNEKAENFRRLYVERLEKQSSGETQDGEYADDDDGFVEGIVGDRVIIKGSEEETLSEQEKKILANQREIEKLQRATDTIKDSIQEMHTGAKRINETGAALGVISNQVGENIKHIGDEIDLFTV